MSLLLPVFFFSSHPYTKDTITKPTKSMGMHALLLNQFKPSDAKEWKESGTIVLPELIRTKEWLTSDKSVGLLRKPVSPPK